MPSRYFDEPNVVIREEQIPEPFRHLLPLARVWCIGDDGERSEFMSGSTNAEKVDLVRAVRPHFEALAEWSAAENSKTPVSDEAILLDGLTLAAAEALISVQDDGSKHVAPSDGPATTLRSRA